MNALCYVYNQRKSFDFDKNICDFLYYWISDILLTYLTTTSSYNSVIGFLFDFFYITPGNKLCDVLHYGMDEEKNFEDIKLMFDYSKDYNAYKEQLTQDNPRCHENYNSYLKKYVDSYKKMQSECEGKKNSVKYCEYFEKYFLNKDPSRLSTLTCELEKTKEGTGRYVGQTQLEPTLGEKSGSEGQDRSSHSDSYSSSTRMSINPAPSTSSSSPIPSKSITAVASIAGFLVPSFLMYKVISIISIVI
ncbi:hypothetical protein PVIIG_05336 [Plasmodium vivax India VII]|uniref:Variable surface protein Vir7-like protein n=1 Tax=Plasmodium vivax India VII TaxID=1077284 RepID=A0A0J9S2V7_PLAVI|nr:hypothetical protein PVIIG_05336 [Plasmodium vivax India VII]